MKESGMLILRMHYSHMNLSFFSKNLLLQYTNVAIFGNVHTYDSV